ELVVDGDFARPTDMIFSVLEGVYDEYMRESFDNYENRRSDIEQLMTYAERFDEILDCLAQLSLMSAVDGDPSGSKAERDPEQVTLSSVHQAKGLEWKIVFVISLTDGMFPNGRVLDADDEYMLEEERRLFYVAITRAKDELYLTYPQINPRSYSGDVIQRPSRFLDDCPQELMEEWQVGGEW
ncbi:MAG: ATP-dependent helicase, partial [Roseibacillus sp.]